MTMRRTILLTLVLTATALSADLTVGTATARSGQKASQTYLKF